MLSTGVPMNEDDILPNRTNNDTMEKSNNGLPFKRGHEMHVSTTKALIHLYDPLGSIVVSMNSSTSMSSYIFSTILKQQSMMSND
jgi:hypothetical protein